MPATPEPRFTPAGASPPVVDPSRHLPGAHLHPLDELYDRAGRPLPVLERIAPEAVPAPYQALLVHNRDMTPTLQQWLGQSLRVRVTDRCRRGPLYFREVVLVGANDGIPAEYGAIKIDLSRFPPAARQQVLEECQPLGQILRNHAIAHAGWPQSFLRLEADEHIQGLLRLDRPGLLYGRRNLLVNAARRILAEVVEVLPRLESGPLKAG